MSAIKLGGLQKSSLIDYPGMISAVIFTQGCNFRCPYCHNPELVNGKRETVNGNPKHILAFLNARVGKLDGIVITGGEPTLHQHLLEFIKQIKDLGFSVKLDTNGTNPEMLQTLIDAKLIDYVAMDIKAPIEKYSEIVCAKVDTEKVLKSIEILKNNNIDYEFRTTVVKSQLLLEDFEKIGALIQDSPKYYLQRFFPTKILDESFLAQSTYSDEEFILIIATLKNYVHKVELR
jgi:pyruvate formate lyase activating enzyme